MGLGDFLRRRGSSDDENRENDPLDPEEYYVLSKQGAQTILSWARFHAQLCEMIHNEMESCDDDDHKVAMLLPFALHPWLVYYDMYEELMEDDEEDNEA